MCGGLQVRQVSTPRVTDEGGDPDPDLVAAQAEVEVRQIDPRRALVIECPVAQTDGGEVGSPGRTQNVSQASS